jgi:hypothetical protein
MDYISALTCIERHLRFLGFSEAEIQAKLVVLLARSRRFQTAANRMSRENVQSKAKDHTLIAGAEPGNVSTRGMSR